MEVDNVTRLRQFYEINNHKQLYYTQDIHYPQAPIHSTLSASQPAIVFQPLHLKVLLRLLPSSVGLNYMISSADTAHKCKDFMTPKNSAV